MIGVVRSLASHLVTGGSGRGVGGEQVEQYLDCDAVHAPPTHAEAQLGEAQRCNEIMNEAFTAAGDDPIIQKMLEAVMEGCVKADEIADETGLSAEEVYEGNRRLRRRLQTAATAKRRRQ